MYFLQNATDQISNSLTPLQDISRTLNHTDTTNTYLVIFTAILAIATIGFGFWDRKRQYDERFDRERPWMTIDGPTPLQVVFANNQNMSWEKFNESSGRDIPPITVKVGMRFTNTGVRPARNLKSIDWTGFNPINKETLQNGPEKDMNMDFGPNQIQHYSFDVNWNMWQNLIEQPIFFALQISYDNGRSRSYSGVIYQLTKGGYVSISSWYS